MEKTSLNFADKIESYNNEMEELCSLSGIYQNHGTFRNTSDFMEHIDEIIATKGIICGN